MFARCKNAVYSSVSFISDKIIPPLKTAIISYIAPTLFSLGGLTATVGRSLYSLRKFIKYLTGVKDHPVFLPLGIVAIIFNTIIYLSTRAVSIFAKFRTTSKQVTMDSSTRKTCSPLIEKQKKLGCGGFTLYSFLLIPCIFYSLTNSIKANLFGHEVAEFIVTDALKYDIHDQEWKENIVLYFGLYVAISNLISYVAFYLPKADVNGTSLTLSIKNKEVTCNKYLGWTVIIAGAATICTPFLEYFSMYGALENRTIEKIIHSSVPNPEKKIVAWGNTIVGTISFCMSSVPAVYNILTHNLNHTFYPPSACEKMITILFSIAAVGDSATTFINNLTGVIFTAKEAFDDLNTKSPEILVPACLFALSTAAVYYFLSQQSLKETKKIYHEKKGNTLYTEIPDASPGNLNTNPSDIKPVKQADSFRLFQSATTTTQHEIKITHTI